MRSNLFVPVFDIKAGAGVHAVAGERAGYRAWPRVERAVMLCIRLLEVCGVQQCYLADLDLIVGQRPQRSVQGELADVVEPVWLNAGICTVAPLADCICRNM